MRRMPASADLLIPMFTLAEEKLGVYLTNVQQTQHSLPSFWLGVEEADKEVVTDGGSKDEEEEVDGAEGVGGGEGAPVGGEVCPQFHTSY